MVRFFCVFTDNWPKIGDMMLHWDISNAAMLECHSRKFVSLNNINSRHSSFCISPSESNSTGSLDTPYGSSVEELYREKPIIEEADIPITPMTAASIDYSVYSIDHRCIAATRYGVFWVRGEARITGSFSTVASYFCMPVDLQLFQGCELVTSQTSLWFFFCLSVHLSPLPTLLEFAFLLFPGTRWKSFWEM